MAEDSTIEWCSHTFNPWRGCTKVNDGCTFCYAEVNMSVKLHGVKWGPNGTRVKASPSMWRKPIAWNRAAENEGDRKRVFCASLADVFEDWDGPILDHAGREVWRCVNCHADHWYDPLKTAQQMGISCCENSSYLPTTMDEIRADLLRLIDNTPWLDWQLLTKRPENVLKMWPKWTLRGHDHPTEPRRIENCWLGTSVSDQKTADEWIPRLIKSTGLCPVLFSSVEPLLGPIRLGCQCFLCDNTEPGGGVCRNCGEPAAWRGLHWFVVGGESGPKARPCDISWIRSIVKQCKRAGIPVFVKQLGSNVTEKGQRVRLQHSKGGDPAEWPEWLRVREFPSVDHASAQVHDR